MRIAVFGATGLVGRLIVREALEAGYEVTAFARDPRPLSGIHDRRLLIVVGDLSNADTVAQMVAGAGAVISVLGPGSRARGAALSEGTRMIVKAMEEHGVKRLVALSTASLRDSRDRFDGPYCLLVSAVRIIFPGASCEIQRIGSVVRASGTDWTLVRIGLLSNRRDLPVRAGHYGRGEVRLCVSRASVSRFMLRLATSTAFVHQAPAISN